MARKPIHLTNAAGHHDQREALWAAMRQLREFTMLDLEEKTRVELDTLRTYITGLTRAGYLERIDGRRRSDDCHGRYIRNRWRLINDVGVEAPRVTRDGKEVTQGRGREQMWRSMRVLKEFTFRDLAVHASTEACPVTHGTAKDYIKYLNKAGYLHCARPARAGRAARYRLIPSRYTGPKPPQIQRMNQVWDPNLGAVVWPKQDQGGEP